MNRFFRSLPLYIKLMLIGFLPVGLLIYLAVDLYGEKKEQIQLIELYRGKIQESAIINTMIDGMQHERRISFDGATGTRSTVELARYRRRVDSSISELKARNDIDFKGFPQYTNLDQLATVRNQIDSNKLEPGAVMHYYSNTIFRLNTLHTVPTATTYFLQPVHQEMVAQKLLSEMATYLGLIRANIYNVLRTGEGALGTLAGTRGSYDVYNSYIIEARLKFSGSIRDSFNRLLSVGPLAETHNYLEECFDSFEIVPKYEAKQWWDLSYQGVKRLRDLKATTWNRLTAELDQIYNKRKSDLNVSVFLLILTMVVALAFTTYMIYIISQALRELSLAARKLSSGITNVGVRVESNDVLGKLAACIAEIDKNNKRLADAAEAIGKGNFETPVKPRSRHDALGNAIAEMQRKLHRYKNKMESLVEMRTRELRRSNEDLQQFAHIASHDLKEPVRKIRTFSSRLLGETDKISEKGKTYIDKIESASARMTGIIDGILTYSMVNTYEENIEQVDLNDIMEGILSDLEVAIAQKKAKLVYSELPEVEGVSILLHQLLYNLVSNALKFTDDQKQPVIRVTGSEVLSDDLPVGIQTDTHDYVKITVSDNGIGFNPEQAERMFNLFTRLNTREKFEGTGLGLALCKKIVERHNGFIRAEGEEGKGASFHIILPRTFSQAAGDARSN
jgi:signal transduction histidine kinase